MRLIFMLREMCTFPKDFQRKEIENRRDELHHLFSEEGIVVAILYGSIVKDGEGKDLDMAILFKSYSFSSYQNLWERLCHLFKADNIDLLPLNMATFLLKKRALLEGTVLYEEAPGIVERLTEDILIGIDDYNFLTNEIVKELSKRLEGGGIMAERHLDKERVKVCLSKLDEAVKKLDTLTKTFTSFEEFIDNVDQRELSVHYLRITLESVLDVCRHFVAVKGVSLTEVDTITIIELAGQRGLIPPEFARSIRGMVGMRNAIVHIYWNLDYQAIYEMLTNRLSDFEAFASYVWNYIKSEDK